MRQCYAHLQKKKKVEISEILTDPTIKCFHYTAIT